MGATPQGRYFTDLYHRWSPAVLQMIAEDSIVSEEVIVTLNLWAPALESLWNGQGGSTEVTFQMQTSVVALLTTLKEKASTDFLAALEQEEAALNLATLAGESMDALIGRVKDRVISADFERLAVRLGSNPLQVNLSLDRTTPSLSYQLLHSPDLGSFSPEGDPQVGDGGPLIWQLDIEPDRSSYFLLDLLGFRQPGAALVR